MGGWLNIALIVASSICADFRVESSPAGFEPAFSGPSGR
jgi:hypothetical protein